MAAHVLNDGYIDSGIPIFTAIPAFFSPPDTSPVDSRRLLTRYPVCRSLVAVLQLTVFLLFR